MIRVGFIGLGGMGMYQAKSFHAVTSCRVAAGVDPSPEMRARFHQTYPDAQVYASPEELLAAAAVDAVVIAVPTGYHQALASTLLAARIPVLLEKPMARTVAQCHQLNEDAAKLPKQWNATNPMPRPQQWRSAWARCWSKWAFRPRAAGSSRINIRAACASAP